MIKFSKLIILMFLIVALVFAPMMAFAGGDKNTNRGSEDSQFGEPAPDTVQEPSQDRTGNPNPGIDNVPDKGYLLTGTYGIHYHEI